MTAWDIIVFLGIAALLWFWLDGLRCKEIARAAGRQASEQAQVQFLDDTVELTKLRLRRSTQGHMAWYREYRFEFTRNGDYRIPGTISMHGQRVVRLDMN